jgi:hypothetical protein
MSPNYRLKLTARLFLAERPQLSRSVSQTEQHEVKIAFGFDRIPGKGYWGETLPISHLIVFRSNDHFLFFKIFYDGFCSAMGML